MAEHGQAVHAPPVVRRGAHRGGRVLPCCGLIPEAEQCLRHLDVDQTRLDVSGLVRLPSGVDPARLGLGPADAGASTASAQVAGVPLPHQPACSRAPARTTAARRG
ncbi:hypothetical protein SMICM17S_06735 [Streptomyces microflavus]